MSSIYNFRNVPEDWYIIVVDIKGSTQATKYHLEQSIKLYAAICISAITKDIKSAEPKLDLPFFFGGDGITVLAPKTYQLRITLVLENIRAKIFKANYLHLRVGAIQILNLNKKTEARLKICKLVLNEGLQIPVAIGNTLWKAETAVKNEWVNDVIEPRQIMHVDYSGSANIGLTIPTHHANMHFLCFMAYPANDLEGLETLRKVSLKMDSIFGKYKARLPLGHVDFKKTDLNIKDWKPIVMKHTNTRYQKLVLSIPFINTLFLRNTTVFDSCINTIVENTYGLMVDGGINDCICATSQQIQTFLDVLHELEKNNEILFGYHISNAAKINCSCTTRSLQINYHIDGSGSSFSKAAQMLKLKKQVMENH